MEVKGEIRAISFTVADIGLVFVFTSSLNILGPKNAMLVYTESLFNPTRSQIIIILTWLRPLQIKGLWAANWLPFLEA